MAALAACVAASFAFIGDDPYLAVGSPAPAIAGKASDGKTYSLESLTKNGSAFVVFWKERCPHNPRAAAMFNALAKAHGEKAPLLGVVTASVEGAAKWTEQFQLTYPMVADADRSIINAYKLRYSICTFEVGKDGKIANVFGGYGSEAMSALNAAMGKASGKDPGSVDLSNAPQRLTWG